MDKIKRTQSKMGNYLWQRERDQSDWNRLFYEVAGHPLYEIGMVIYYTGA